MWEIGLPLQFAHSLPDNPTDAELVESCKRGNLRAFERLYELHAGRMKSLAFHLLGSRADAEDTVQEAFLKVYRAVRGFEGHSSLSTWIYRILINCCYDVMRKQQRLARADGAGEMAERFSECLRKKAGGVWEAQHAHPFVRGIGEGTVGLERFKFWVRHILRTLPGPPWEDAGAG